MWGDETADLQKHCIAVLATQSFLQCDRLLLAHLGIHPRPPWRPVSGVLRARCLPMVETGISSIRKQRSGCVAWRPVLKQVLPCRPRSSATRIDPLRTSIVHRSGRQVEVLHSATTTGGARFREPALVAHCDVA